MSPKRIAVALTLSLCFPWKAFPRGDEDLRNDTEVMESVLERAVRKVSQPSAAPFFGATDQARAYRLPGYGVVFVVPPRSLPRDLRSQGLTSGPVVPPRQGQGQPSLTIEDLARPLPQRDDVKSLTIAPGPEDARMRAARERDLEAIEAKVEALSEEAERQRLEAEHALDAAMQQVRVRLTVPAEPLPPPPGRPQAPELGEPGPPAPPPWHFWIETSRGGQDPRSSDRIVDDVKLAVTDALEAAGGSLKSVRPEEYVVVAVDFVPLWDFGGEARAGRTLIVKAKKKDLADRDLGRISPEELKKRVEIQQY